MNKVAIVTGASRGIGAATAVLLAEQGYKVCINYLKSQTVAENLCASINQNGGQAIALQADVASEADVEALFKATQAEFGAVTHLVNNVGILFNKTSFSDISAQRLMKVLQSNVLSAFLCSQYYVKQHIGYGAIVNVSSVSALSGSPFEYIDYAASKGALDSMTRGLSIELAKENIRVNGVRPGFIETDIHADGGEPDRVSRLAKHIPMQRGGSPQEVAQAISWLLSDEASYVTGSFIDIAGGKR